METGFRNVIIIDFFVVMHIIFLTMVNLTEVDTHGIYQDLMRKFRNEGHDIYIVSPRERRSG